MTNEDILIGLALIVGFSTVFAIGAVICDYFAEREALDFYNKSRKD